MSIDNHSHKTPYNHIERKWRPQERPSDTNYYCGKQQRLLYLPKKEVNVIHIG